ncbi:hypothetical protein DBT_0271 [Dissulfuribacter thermophilus]|uniref:Tetratricopeptide repeat protein n=1 Tax=Dissulfuribacter thermophilus TaxID=1156395 RepID=A0A1B9F9B0_9BACT|nr:hypothetical protein [Dissulfuribacter thermophilus]OCC16454.1 hypothetical protein DBT_0271 [Dissulfuribacter thermophilus]
MAKDCMNSAWFKEHRDFFVTRVVQDFLKSYAYLASLEDAFFQKEPLFRQLNELVGNQEEKGILWRLKDRCHQLWRDIDPDVDPDAFFFDWMVGTLFHEAMKLKENAYMLERYAPSYEIALMKVPDDSNSRKYKRFFEETLQDMDRGMERIRCLYKNAAQRLLHLIKRERENGILIRMLLEDIERAQKFLMEKGDCLLSWLFPEGIHLAYLIAGESYLEGGWYVEARMSFEEVLKIAPDCYEAKKGLQLLEKRLKEMALYGAGYLVKDRVKLVSCTSS